MNFILKNICLHHKLWLIVSFQNENNAKEIISIIIQICLEISVKTDIHARLEVLVLCWGISIVLTTDGMFFSFSFISFMCPTWRKKNKNLALCPCKYWENEARFPMLYRLDVICDYVEVVK